MVKQINLKSAQPFRDYYKIKLVFKNCIKIFFVPKQ